MAQSSCIKNRIERVKSTLSLCKKTKSRGTRFHSTGNEISVISVQKQREN